MAGVVVGKMGNIPSAKDAAQCCLIRLAAIASNSGKRFILLINNDKEDENRENFLPASTSVHLHGLSLIDCLLNENAGCSL